ncbi:MAG: hypothetical protein HZC41_14490 [Chloroflexi bacterium]|nr:hypothetical protein [Chloroflexota bacterium]
MFKRLVVLAILVALTFSTIQAQNNEDLAACTEDEITEIAVAVSASDFGDDYSALVSKFEDMDIEGGDLLDLSADVSELQETWWSEIVSDFPDCVIAQKIALTGGRMMDELLISVSIGQVAYNEEQTGSRAKSAKLLKRFQYHIAQWTGLQTEFLALINEAMD